MGESVLVVLGVLAFIALVIVAVVYSNRAAEARRIRMAEFASSRGLHYAPYGLASEPSGCLTGPFSASYQQEQEYLENFLGFQPFGVGSARSVRDRIFGNAQGLYWEIFSYSYTVSSGKSSTTCRYTIVAAQFDFVVPDIDIRRENFLDRIGSWVGIRDMQFESIEFNEAYHVKSHDERRAYDVIHPKAIDYLMNCPISQWQLAGRTVLLLDSGTVDIATVTCMMDAIVDFVALVPDYYRDDNRIVRV